MPIRLVLFDLDDTLCDHATSFRLRIRRALDALPPEQLTADPAEVIARALQHPSHTWEAVERELIAAGITDGQSLARAYEVYSSDRFYGLRLFEDSVAAVRAVSTRALIGLVTNGPSRIQRAKLTRLGIERLFPFVIVSEELGVAKPDPAIFHHALSLAGVRPEEALYVGDHPINDVVGAQRAGLWSVWCNRAGREWDGESRPHAVVSSLWELYRLIEGWASGAQAEPGESGILQRGGRPVASEEAKR